MHTKSVRRSWTNLLASPETERRDFWRATVCDFVLLRSYGERAFAKLFATVLESVKGQSGSCAACEETILKAKGGGIGALSQLL